MNEYVLNSIANLISEYVAQPFLHLREYGAQAQLWQILQQQMNLSDEQMTTNFTIDGIPFAMRHFQWNNTSLSRVQREIKIIEQANQNAITECDLAILRKPGPVVLTCDRGGPADILRKVRLQDLEVAIEIKAGPSNNVSSTQRRSIADVIRLHQLAAAGVDAHFVFLDKSIPIPGFAEADKAFNGFIDMSEWQYWPPGSAIHMVAPEERPFVAVWDIDAQLLPRRRFFVAG